MDEIKKHHRRLTLFAAATVMFLLLLAGISHSSPPGAELAEHLHAGVSLTDPALLGTSGETFNDFQHSAATSFVLPAQKVQSITKNLFFHASGKRFEITASVSPRGPPAHS